MDGKTEAGKPAAAGSADLQVAEVLAGQKFIIFPKPLGL